MDWPSLHQLRGSRPGSCDLTVLRIWSIAYQAKLRASCTPYSVSGIAPPPFFHTIHDAVPISAYSTDQAGPALHALQVLSARCLKPSQHCVDI